MNVRIATLATIVALAALVAGPLRAADDEAAPEPVTRVVKFVATRNGAAQGKRVLMLRASGKYGGKPEQYVVPNADPESRKIDPDPAIGKVVKDAKAGDFLKVTYTEVRRSMVLSQIEAYTPKPGEVDPEACEFLETTEKTEGDATLQAVVVNQRDKKQTLFVPTIKDADGKDTADPAVLAQIAKLKTGDYADFATSKSGGKTVVSWIFPYQEGESATFGKLASKRNEAGTLESTVTLNAGDKEVTVTVRPTQSGGPADRALLSKVKSLKSKAAVLYKAVEEGGQRWLIDIQPDKSSQPAGDVTMTGTFMWNGRAGQNHDLKAVLTPTGRGKYSAVYTFTWNGRPKTYIGSVTGNLRRGEVSGSGDGDRRNFTFSGTSNGGVITFKCFETTGGRTRNQGSGTLRLSR